MCPASAGFWPRKESSVSSRSYPRIAAVALLMTVACSTASAWRHKHGQRVRVRFLATSTLIRGTFGQNEDTYLAQVFTRRGDESYLIRLIDAYPNEAPPLSFAALTSDVGTLLRILRDQQCDRAYGEMLLRTAPGDPMAILPERLGYRPPMKRTPAPETILPCYRTVPQ